METTHHALLRIESARKCLSEIAEKHESALKTQIMPDDFTIHVGVAMEHLRSALDYVAGYLYRKCVPNASSQERTYFPIGAKDKAFKKGWLRQLGDVRPDLVDHLRSIQQTPWLCDLRTLSNISKHVEPTHHSASTHLAMPRVYLRSLRFHLDSTRAQRGEYVDWPEQSETVWSQLRFSKTGGAVLPFLETAISGTKQIVFELADKADGV